MLPSTLQRRVKEWRIETFSTIPGMEITQGSCAVFLMQEKVFLEVTWKHRIKRSRLRLSVQRVTGAQLNPHSPIARKTYCILGPNYLWYVNGNHKMIKWCTAVLAVTLDLSPIFNVLQTKELILLELCFKSPLMNM